MASQTPKQDGTPPEVNPATSEVSDTADNSPRGPQPDTSGKRVRAIPYQKGSTIRVREATFAEHNIQHPTVVWDFRKDNFTVAVGTKDGEISPEAAEFLTTKYKETFEYLG